MAQTSEPFFRLIYACQAAEDCAPDMEGALSDILAVAIPRNRIREITGLLIGHRGWFIHAVEGREPAVRETVDFVRDDRRCQPLSVLAEDPIDQRQFADWHLAARVLSPADTAVIRDFDAPDDFDPARLPRRVLMRLFAVVAEAHAHRFTAQQQQFVRRH